MDKLSTQSIDKPQHLHKYDLIAIMGIYDKPKEIENSTKQSYIKSEIAFNEITGKVQVYVTAEKESGLNKFKKDYPNAEIKKNSRIR